MDSGDGCIDVAVTESRVDLIARFEPAGIADNRLTARADNGVAAPECRQRADQLERLCSMAEAVALLVQLPVKFSE